MFVDNNQLHTLNSENLDTLFSAVYVNGQGNIDIRVADFRREGEIGGFVIGNGIRKPEIMVGSVLFDNRGVEIWNVQDRAITIPAMVFDLDQDNLRDSWPQPL